MKLPKRSESTAIFFVVYYLTRRRVRAHAISQFKMAVASPAHFRRKSGPRLHDEVLSPRVTYPLRLY